MSVQPAKFVNLVRLAFLPTLAGDDKVMQDIADCWLLKIVV